MKSNTISIVCLTILFMVSWSIYSPSNMYRTTHSATLNLSATSSTFTVNYPSSPWSVAPHMLHSITSLVFNGGLTFDVAVSTLNTTTLTCTLSYLSVLTKIGLSFLIFDSTLYPISITQYSYTTPTGVTGSQTIQVLGMQSHQASFLTAMDLRLGSIPGGFIPSALSMLVSQGEIIRTNLTISYNTDQLTIHKYKVYYVDFDVAGFKGLDYYKAGQKWTLYGTSGAATDPYQTINYISQYSKNYLTGITTIYNGEFLFGELSLDSLLSITTRVYYFSSQILIVSYFCPSSFPYTDYTDSSRQYCYSGCNASHYYDGQFMCQPCDSNCLSCSFSPTNCTECSAPYVLKYGFICGCPENTYEQTFTNGSITCLSCDSVMAGCYSCSSSLVCTQCMNNLILSGGNTCSCGAGTYLMTIGQSSYCVNGIAGAGGYVTESCENGYQQEELSCQCTDASNLTLVNGVCQ